MQNELEVIKDVVRQTGFWSSLREGGIIYLAIGRHASGAIGRLISGLADIPVAYLQSFSQGIQDRTNAHSEITQSIAKVASATATKDSELIDRAILNWQIKETRKQKNKENVAQRTIDLLVADPPQQESSGPSDDFMNFFEIHCENASSEAMQDLFARVLAGEIRNEGTFSLRTIQFMSVMDQGLATTIQKFRNWVSNDIIIRTEAFSTGSVLTEAQILDDVSILQAEMGIHMTYEYQEFLYFLFDRKGIRITPAQNAKVVVSSIFLTPLGKEIISILPRQDDMIMINNMAQSLCKNPNIKCVELFDIFYVSSTQFHPLNPTQISLPPA